MSFEMKCFTAGVIMIVAGNICAFVAPSFDSILMFVSLLLIVTGGLSVILGLVEMGLK